MCHIFSAQLEPHTEAVLQKVANHICNGHLVIGSCFKGVIPSLSPSGFIQVMQE